MAAVNGTSANGLWSLFVFDDSVGDAGQITAAAGRLSVEVNDCGRCGCSRHREREEETEAGVR